jgi:hypothetical protein
MSSVNQFVLLKYYVIQKILSCISQFLYDLTLYISFTSVEAWLNAKTWIILDIGQNQQYT